MVLKLSAAVLVLNVAFESDVISDGTQTAKYKIPRYYQFESDVISDGTQTSTLSNLALSAFESDVISDGTQTMSTAKT